MTFTVIYRQGAGCVTRRNETGEDMHRTPDLVPDSSSNDSNWRDNAGEDMHRTLIGPHSSSNDSRENRDRPRGRVPAERKPLPSRR